MKKVCLMIRLFVEEYGRAKVAAHGVPADEGDDIQDIAQRIVYEALKTIRPEGEWICVSRKPDIKNIIFMDKNNNIATADCMVIDNDNHKPSIENEELENGDFVQDLMRKLRNMSEMVKKARDEHQKHGGDPRSN